MHLHSLLTSRTTEEIVHVIRNRLSCRHRRRELAGVDNGSTALLHNMHLLLEVVHLYSCVPAKQRALATNLEHVFAACIEVLPESGLSHLQTVFLKEIVPVVRGTLASLS